MKGLGVAVIVRAGAGEGGEARTPVIERSPEILHALGAFIENAVSFAATRVDATASWTADQVVITITDDGPGFSPEVLPKLGEPYISERSEARLGGGRAFPTLHAGVRKIALRSGEAAYHRGGKRRAENLP